MESSKEVMIRTNPMAVVAEEGVTTGILAIQNHGALGESLMAKSGRKNLTDLMARNHPLN